MGWGEGCGAGEGMVGIYHLVERDNWGEKGVVPYVIFHVYNMNIEIEIRNAPPFRQADLVEVWFDGVVGYRICLTYFEAAVVTQKVPGSSPGRIMCRGQ